MLLDLRAEWEPHEYPQFYQHWFNHRIQNWNHTKTSFSQDVYDWQHNLLPKEKNLAGAVLKGFTQTELTVGFDFWSNKVAKWFPKPEIIAMALEFAAGEMNHVVSYSQIDSNLGIKDYKGFLQEPSVKAKIDNLVNVKGKTKEEKALALAIFSGCTEGVNLFCSFAILLNFSRFQLLPGIGAIINYSIIDESIHSAAGCELFKIFAEEYKLWSPTMKQKIYEAFRLSVQLEDNFLEKAFEMGDVKGLTQYQLKQFIRQRANQKLQELGLKANWKNIDQQAFEEIDTWFSGKTAGEKDVDLFVRRGTGTYNKGLTDWSTLWEGNER